MNTPVCDFVRAYAEGDPVRMHMPGHKGRALIGPEALDLTERYSDPEDKPFVNGILGTVVREHTV